MSITESFSLALKNIASSKVRTLLMLCIQVAPKERHQFTFSQSADQFQVEHGQDISGVCGVQIGL